jgi:hypothetical protein
MKKDLYGTKNITGTIHRRSSLIWLPNTNKVLTLLTVIIAFYAAICSKSHTQSPSRYGERLFQDGQGTFEKKFNTGSFF